MKMDEDLKKTVRTLGFLSSIGLSMGLALIESLCIYALLICLLMVFKIPDFAAFIEKVIQQSTERAGFKRPSHPTSLYCSQY